MKTFVGFLSGIFIMVYGSISMKAQDVYITVPENNIFNRSEFTTLQTILNTQNHTNWRAGSIDPTIRSTSGDNFMHTTRQNTFLPTSILPWRLASIGGAQAPFKGGDTWPTAKWFTTGDQTWYQPVGTNGKYKAGNVVFTFKIPAVKFEQNDFHAGKYSINVTHNYDRSGFYIIEFTPNNLNVILDIPPFIKWLTTTATKHIEISSLNDYRSPGTRTLGDLGNAELGNTVDFNLWAKTSATNIQFVSSKGVTGTRNISSIQLGSRGSELTQKALSASSQNFSAAIFGVEAGNRTNFIPQFLVSAADLKTHFFEAGTYTFQLNLDAKSVDNTISRLQNTDVTLKVLPLSEITIPPSSKTINFNFNTAADYRKGQSKVMLNQIKFSNNENFELYVKSDENYFKKGGVQTDVNSNILQIGIIGSSVDVLLSKTPKKIFESDIPMLDQELNINYTISPTSAQSLVGKEKASYFINVIYSFTAL